MLRLPLGDHLFAPFTKDLIPEGDHPLIHIDQPRPNDHRLIIAGRVPVAAMNICYDQFVSGRVEIGLTKPLGPTELGASHLKPDQVIGIVGHTHLVCFRIPHPDLTIH